MNIIELDKDKSYMIILEDFTYKDAKDLHEALLSVGIHSVILSDKWCKGIEVKTLQTEE